MWTTPSCAFLLIAWRWASFCWSGLGIRMHGHWTSSGNGDRTPELSFNAPGDGMMGKSALLSCLGYNQTHCWDCMVIWNYGGSRSEKVEGSPIKETVSQTIRVNKSQREILKLFKGTNVFIYMYFTDSLVYQGQAFYWHKGNRIKVTVM